jgi:lipoprotein-releasing system ATP-binding protein
MPGGGTTVAILEARDLKKSYWSGPAELPVLRGAQLSVERGEVVVIVGASGVGKSTLLHILGALDRASSGEVDLDGHELSRLSDRELADLRGRKVGFVFQFHHLLPEFSALENVMIPKMVIGVSKAEAERAARAVLEEVGLAERTHHRPAQLSGGEQQRVAVARALVNEPAVVLADEPSGNLDRATGDRLQDLLWRLRESRRQTFVIATHDPSLAARADRVLSMADGVLSTAAPETIRSLTAGDRR